MKQVYAAANAADAQMCKDYLEAIGIPAIVKGEFLSGAAGELPANTYPTVWVVEDRDFELALKKVRMYESSSPEDQMFDTSWACPDCGESIDAQFTQCWKCGHERDPQLEQ